MAQRFQGPYKMPKGAGGRVPPTRGGTIAPAGVNPPPGGWTGKGRMAPIPSRATRRMARIASAFQMVGSSRGAAGFLVFDAIAEPLLQWYLAPVGAPAYDLSGWTIICENGPTQPILEPFRKVGINPGVLVGAINAVERNCTVSGSGVGNAADGTTIPVGATYVQVCESGFPFGSPAPFGGQGRPFLRARLTTGNTFPRPYVPGKVTLPMPEEYPEVIAQPQPLTGGGTTRGKYILPYQSEAVTIVISRPRNDGSESEATRPRPRPNQGSRPVPGSGGGIIVTDDPVTNLPPPATEREVKTKTPLGKSLASLRHQYGKLTEIGDVAKCLEKALPPGHPCRRKGRGLDERVVCLLRHAADIDLGAAATCIAADQVSDAVIGKLSRAASRNLRRSPYTPKRPYPLGPLTGGFGARMR